MKITLAEAFKKYPFKPSRVALHFQRSREWVLHLSYPETKLSDVTRMKNLALVEEYFHQLGNELVNLKLSNIKSDDSMEIGEFFQSYPFTISAVADRMQRSREWISQMVVNRYRCSQGAREKHILAIQEYMHKLGKELKTIELYDKKA